MENKHNRFLWMTTLEMKFHKALDKSVEGFTSKEKAEFLELLIQYIRLLEEEDADVSAFFMEKFIKPFKSKLKTASQEKLFSGFFDKDLAWTEMDIISTEIFNSLPAGEQGMTDEEFVLYLDHLTFSLRGALQFHYIYAHDDTEENQPDTLQGASVKGRIPRSAGDNLTKLNQEQTALLIEYLKQGRVILKDEYLNDKQAGLAFSILTGYSQDNLRIKLSPKEIDKIKNKANLTELHNVLTYLTLLIDKDLKGRK